MAKLHDEYEKVCQKCLEKMDEVKVFLQCYAVVMKLFVDVFNSCNVRYVQFVFVSVIIHIIRLMKYT